MLDHVKDYYGKILQSSSDLQTDACCTLDEPPLYIKKILSNIHDEVMMRYFGCGLVAPTLLRGLKILDLGCGAGRDVYCLSALAGETGQVIGVDMTDEQLQIANRHIDYHTKEFGYKAPNVSFYKGYIEKLDELPFKDSSFDLIVSNCVINLASDKSAVLKSAKRLLKPGGEMYFSDVYSNRRIDKELVENKTLYGECLSGALYWNDFIQLAKANGFGDPRLVEDRPLTIENDEIKALIGHIDFYSATYRLLNIANLEAECEDYGQAVCYKGGIEYSEDSLLLDKHHLFHKQKIQSVCGNTYRMLNESRYKNHFDFYGTWDNHYGIFEGCGTNIPFSQNSEELPCC